MSVAFTSDRLARVVKIHPEASAVDLLFLDDFSRVPMVQVMSPSASTNTGLIDLEQPAQSDPSDPYNPKETKDRDVYAVVGYIGQTPVVRGFLFPQVCQMLFKDVGRRINRHGSDVYTNLTETGDFEFFHPSGTYFRIGTAAAHEDLTAKDFDKKWKIGKNTSSQPRVHLEVWNGGAQKATVDIDKDGNVAITNIGTLTSTSTGNVQIESTSGNITLKASSGTVTIDTPTAHATGNVNVDQTVTATTDVVGGGKHLKTHTHSGVTAGAGTSGPPS